MTHRLDVDRRECLVVLDFQGLLDDAAVEGLRTAIAAARAAGCAARVVLREGTEVERACLAALRGLDAEVRAEAAYLESWLHDAK